MSVASSVLFVRSGSSPSTMPTPSSRTPAMPRYEELAGFICDLVEQGTLRPGMRAPSLRRIANEHNASMSTALHAYRLLEDRGVLEARPKSGFYVAKGGEVTLKIPRPSRPPKRPSRVTISSSVTELLEYASDPNFVPLGCAIPSAELLAAGRLDRFLARVARTRGVEFNVYNEPRGQRDLREEICRRAIRWGQATSPDDVAITCGCTEALSLALQATTRRGDTVAIESPTYFGLLQVLEALGLKALELPTSPDDGLGLAQLEAAASGNRIAACLLSSSFNNPLGHAISEPKKLEILHILERHAIPLIEDDIYGDISFRAERPKPFSALPSNADIIYCSSFSKTIAPGYRIGWVVSQRHMPAILQQKFSQTLCGPPLPQVAMAEFLRSGGYDSHLRRLRRIFADHIDRMTRAIDRSFPSDTRVTRPEGGFVLWLELPPACNARELLKAALAQGICFVPGDMFSASSRFQNCIRLSCGEAWGPRIEQAVKQLGELVHLQISA